MQQMVKVDKESAESSRRDALTLTTIKAKNVFDASGPDDEQRNRLFLSMVDSYKQCGCSLEALGVLTTFAYDLDAPIHFQKEIPFKDRSDCYKNSRFQLIDSEDVRKFYENLFIGDKGNQKPIKDSGI